jgi:hypothetical protein
MSSTMKRFQWFSSTAAGLAALGMILPTGVLAAEGPPAAAPTAARQQQQALDVSLADGGILSGQVVDAQGTPIAGTQVKLRSMRGETATGYTDAHGQFQLRGLPGGLYEVNAAQRSATCRLWAANSGPPSAVRQVMLVAGQDVTRGQPYIKGPQGGQYFGGTGAVVGGVIILGALGGVVAGGIITGLQEPSGS